MTVQVVWLDVHMGKDGGLSMRGKNHGYLSRRGKRLEGFIETISKEAKVIKIHQGIKRGYRMQKLHTLFQ